MPLKNGFECLVEIRRSEKLRPLPVVIFSTTSQPSAVDEVYQNGAHLFIRKPNDFTSLKKMIQYVLSCDWKANADQPPKEEFILDLA
jgi:DNA-binding NarL/FixJ family response regulator